MNSKEEYLLKYQESLLEKLAGSFSSLNKDILACFSLLFVFLLFQYNMLEEPSVEGFKLKISPNQALFLFPLIICIPYLLINNSIHRVAKIIKLLKANSVEIKNLNPEARPFDASDLDYLTDGIAGLQLSISKLIVKYLLAKKIIDFDISPPPKSKDFKSMSAYLIKMQIQLISKFRALSNKLFITLIWFVFLVLIFILPLGIPLMVVYYYKVEAIFATFHFPDSLTNMFFLECCLLLLMIIYTLISNLYLYTFYFRELTDLKDDITVNGYQQLLHLSKNISEFFKKK